MQSVPPSSLRSSLPSGIGIFEFVAMMASMMSMVALQIDPMLPALPQMGRDLHVADPNHRQYIILFFFLGLAVGALVFGPLSDRFGRRPVLFGAGLGMLLAALCCAFAHSFELMLAARLFGGFCAASSRVMVVSIVRDCFHGDRMARIMSFVLFIFIVVPMIAPTLGQLVLFVAPWRAIFWILSGAILLQFLWVTLRLPETLEPERRIAIGPRDLARTFLLITSHRNAIGHMIASGLMQAGLVGFLVSVQQIFFDVFHRPGLFPLGFACISLGMGIGSLLNGRLVGRFGARRLSQSAVIGIVSISLVHAGLIAAGVENIVTFIVLQGMLTTCFSFAGANFSAISLEPFSRGAGLASAIQACLTTILSALLGGIVGSYFDGTTLPMTLGFTAFGSAAFFFIAWAERWRLFRRPGHSALREPTLPVID